MTRSLPGSLRAIKDEDADTGCADDKLPGTADDWRAALEALTPPNRSEFNSLTARVEELERQMKIAAPGIVRTEKDAS